jgi:lysophospholipase L1-like esterase
MQRNTLLIVILCTLLGIILALATLFYSDRLQRSLVWRSEAWFNRVPNAQIHMERETLGLWSRGIPLSPKNQTLLLGDSHLHGLPGNALGTNVLNLAIGGLTAERLDGYLANGALVLPESAIRVLLIGHNDLNTETPTTALEKSITQLIELLNKNSNLFVMEMLPRPFTFSTNASLERTKVINSVLRRACEATPTTTPKHKCHWISTNEFKGVDGFLKPEFALPNDVHLSVAGYAKLIEVIASRASLRAI